MTTPYKDKLGKDLDNVFEPLEDNTKASKTNYRVDGSDLNDRYASVVDGHKITYDTGYKVNGIDLKDIFAKKGSLQNDANSFEWTSNDLDPSPACASQSFTIRVGTGGTCNSSSTQIWGGWEIPSYVTGNLLPVSYFYLDDCAFIVPYEDDDDWKASESMATVRKKQGRYWYSKREITLPDWRCLMITNGTSSLMSGAIDGGGATYHHAGETYDHGNQSASSVALGLKNMGVPILAYDEISLNYLKRLGFVTKNGNIGFRILHDGQGCGGVIMDLSIGECPPPPEAYDFNSSLAPWDPSPGRRIHFEDGGMAEKFSPITSAAFGPECQFPPGNTICTGAGVPGRNGTGSHVGIGDYPSMRTSFNNVMHPNSSLDSLAIDRGVRLKIWSGENYTGSLVLDETGPCIIQNTKKSSSLSGLWYTMNAKWDTAIVPGTNETYGSLFPTASRSKWSSSNMNDWQGGSCKARVVQ